jgi:hypothetical protein
MSSVVLRVVLGLETLLLVGLGATGCGHDVAVIDTIGGDDVGRMAERQLEAENPELAAGTLACPDLRFRVGESVHCTRTTELSGGRVVKVHGVVTVMSLSSGGRLHVRMAERATEFGLAGHELAAGLSRRWEQRFHVRPSRVECPYLRGEVGATVTCRVKVGGVRHDTEVVVTRVDPQGYRTTYTTRPHR